MNNKEKTTEKNLKIVGEPPIRPVNTDPTVRMSREPHGSLSCCQFQCISLGFKHLVGISKDLKMHKATIYLMFNSDILKVKSQKMFLLDSVLQYVRKLKNIPE